MPVFIIRDIVEYSIEADSEREARGLWEKSLDALGWTNPYQASDWRETYIKGTEPPIGPYSTED